MKPVVFNYDDYIALKTENERLRRINENLQEQLAASQCRTDAARNELCLKCGRYREAHKGVCDGCKWKEN